MFNETGPADIVVFNLDPGRSATTDLNLPSTTKYVLVFPASEYGVAAPIPFVFPEYSKLGLPSSVAYLAPLLGAALFISLAIRGRFIEGGIGMIIFGVVGYKLAGLLGVPPQNVVAASILSSFIGILVIWMAQ